MNGCPGSVGQNVHGVDGRPAPPGVGKEERQTGRRDVIPGGRGRRSRAGPTRHGVTLARGRTESVDSHASTR